MCGIVAYIGQEQPIINLMYLMADNQSRGKHSTGAYIDGKILKTEGLSTELISMINKNKIENAELFIGHTRHATHGAKTAENTHPYTYGKYIGVHNGMLSNYDMLLNEHGQKQVDVDSKAIFKLLNVTDNYRLLGEFDGTINAVWTESDGQLYVYRRNNPLFRFRNNKGIFFSSLREGLELISGDPDQVKEVTPNKLFIYSPTGEKVDSIVIENKYPDYDGPNWNNYRGYGNAYARDFHSYIDNTPAVAKTTETKEEEEDDWYQIEQETMQEALVDLQKAIKLLEDKQLIKMDETQRLQFLLEQVTDIYSY
jgi:glucosamine 6-phosphate synthetase-like amidotransferase/phosphosugar isomerase protein